MRSSTLAGYMICTNLNILYAHVEYSPTIVLMQFTQTQSSLWSISDLKTKQKTKADVTTWLGDTKVSRVWPTGSDVSGKVQFLGLRLAKNETCPYHLSA